MKFQIIYINKHRMVYNISIKEIQRKLNVHGIKIV